MICESKRKNQSLSLSFSLSNESINVLTSPTPNQAVSIYCESWNICVLQNLHAFRFFLTLFPPPPPYRYWDARENCCLFLASLQTALRLHIHSIFEIVNNKPHRSNSTNKMQWFDLDDWYYYCCCCFYWFIHCPIQFSHKWREREKS